MGRVSFEIDGTTVSTETGGNASFEFAMGLLYPNPGAASVEVGTTTTLPAGSDATVTNSGTPGDLVLDFGIPQGEPFTFDDFTEEQLEELQSGAASMVVAMFSPITNAEIDAITE